MRKSPLSSLGGANRGGNFYRGRGGGGRGNRGYGYNNMRNNNNFYRFPGPSNMQTDQLNGDMIPLSSSSPIVNQNRGSWRPQNDRIDRRFSNTGVSGSHNNQRNSFPSSPGSPYSPNKFQQPNHQRGRFQQKRGFNQHKKLPISEWTDFRTIDEDPWRELDNMINSKKAVAKLNDSSVEIIYDRNGIQESSSDIISDNSTINISSSCDEIKEGSSVDLPLENMNFNQESKDSSLLSASVTSQSEISVSETTQQSQDDSVVEIVY